MDAQIVPKRHSQFTIAIRSADYLSIVNDWHVRQWELEKFPRYQRGYHVFVKPSLGEIVDRKHRETGRELWMKLTCRLYHKKPSINPIRRRYYYEFTDASAAILFRLRYG